MQLRFGIEVFIACQPFTSQCQMHSVTLRPVQFFHFSWLSNDQIRSNHITKAHSWPKARIGCAARHAAGELKCSLCVAMLPLLQGWQLTCSIGNMCLRILQKAPRVGWDSSVTSGMRRSESDGPVMGILYKQRGAFDMHKRLSQRA